MADIGDAWIAASVGAFTGLLGAAVTMFVHVNRTRREYGLELSAESLARELLNHPKWRLRQFTTIKRHIAGFQDDELRKILVRAGAVRFEADGDIEWWGLVRRNRKLLSGAERGPAIHAAPLKVGSKGAVLPPGLNLAAPNDGPALPGAGLAPAPPRRE